MAAPTISVVIPVYRNASTLEELASRLLATLGAHASCLELVFVDDASPDQSSDVLRMLADRHTDIRVQSLSRNVGQNRAVLAGLEHARGAVAVVMDADLQDQPESIPTLLSALEGDVHAVFGGRKGRYESAVRLVTSRLHKELLHRVSNRRVPLDAGLFVAMSRTMIDRIVAYPDRDPYVLSLMARTRLSMISIPVERARRPDGQSSYGLAGRLRVAWRALSTSLPRRGAR